MHISEYLGTTVSRLVCIDSKKVRYKSSVPTGTWIICNEPILKTREIGNLLLVSQETGEGEPDLICNETCLHSLGPARPELVKWMSLSVLAQSVWLCQLGGFLGTRNRGRAEAVEYHKSIANASE